MLRSRGRRDDTRSRGADSAVDRLADSALGVPELDADPAWRLAAAFLAGFRGHTRRAYFGDIRARYAWCTQAGNVRPLGVTQVTPTYR